MKVNLAFLLSSAKHATSLRLISLAERNLQRYEEAEETLVSAMNIFKGARVRTSLQSVYYEEDGMESGSSDLVDEV